MLEFTVDRNRDLNGSKLQRLLEAQISCERIAAAGVLVARLLSIIGVVTWLEAIWPDLLPPDIRVFAIGVFAGNVILALGVVIEEIACCVRRNRCLKANEGVILNDTRGSD